RKTSHCGSIRAARTALPDHWTTPAELPGGKQCGYPCGHQLLRFPGYSPSWACFPRISFLLLGSSVEHHRSSRMKDPCRGTPGTGVDEIPPRGCEPTDR